MFCLYDTFNNRVISRHRSVIAVVRASEQLSRHMKANGTGGYLPTTIAKIIDGDPVRLQPDESTEDAETLEYYLQMQYDHCYSPLSEIK